MSAIFATLKSTFEDVEDYFLFLTIGVQYHRLFARDQYHRLFARDQYHRLFARDQYHRLYVQTLTYEHNNSALSFLYKVYGWTGTVQLLMTFLIRRH
jgi:hypothetical protein